MTIAGSSSWWAQDLQHRIDVQVRREIRQQSRSECVLRFACRTGNIIWKWEKKWYNNHERKRNLEVLSIFFIINIPRCFCCQYVASRHARQNVCWHWSILGALRRFSQIGQTTKLSKARTALGMYVGRLINWNMVFWDDSYSNECLLLDDELESILFRIGSAELFS